MKTKKVAMLPKCDFCDKPAEYDAPTIHGGRWANMCPEHLVAYGNNTSIGTQFLIRKNKSKAKLSACKIVNGIEEESVEYWESVTFGSENREIECPECGEMRSVEPDAYYVFICEGCGVKIRCPAGLC